MNIDRFTAKELDVLSLVVMGMKNKRIAAILGIKEQAVRHQCQNIYNKTGMSDRFSLWLWCKEEGFID